MSFQDLGIRRKLALTTLLALLPLLLLGVTLSVYLISDTIRQENLRQEEIAFASIATALRLETRVAESDIRFLASLPAIPEILRAQAHQGFDPVSSLSLNQSLQQLQRSFARFLVARKVYDQVRFLSKSGQELVRVDLAGDRAEVIPADQLQFKGDRYYFQEAAKLPQGKVYVSKIDLNREWGKVERPFKPMLRLATPIYDEAGALQGVLILNRYADHFLDHILDAPQKLGGVWFVTDDKGYFIHHNQNGQRLWGGPEDLDTGKGLAQDFPQHYQQILAGESTYAIWQGRLWRAHPQRFNLCSDHARYITVARMTPKPSFIDHLRRDTWLLVSMAFLAALLAGLTIWWSARRITQPILDLDQAVVQFSQGQWESRAPATARDEVGNLSLNFNAMADKLTHLTQNLEEEVRGRTEELREYKDHLEVKVAERTLELAVANEQMELERQRLLTVLETMPAYVALLAPNHTISYVNREFRNRFGDPGNRLCHEFMFGQQEPCENCKTFEVFKTKVPAIWEWTGPDQRTYQIFDHPFTDTDGAMLVLELGLDITDRKRAEDQLRLTQFAVESSVDLISRISPDGRFLYVNEASCRDFGYSQEEYLQLTVSDVCPDIPKEKWPEHFQEIKENRSLKLEVNLQRRDGSLFPAEVSANYLKYDGQEYNIAIARDITDRKRAEHDLRESEERYRLLVQQIPAVVFRGYADWSVDFFDDKVEGLTGYSKADFEAHRLKWNDLILAEDLEQVQSQFITAARQHSPYVREYRIRHREGGIAWVQERAHISFNAQGRIGHVSGIFFDITDQKRTYDALQKWAHIYEHADWGVVVGSADGTTLDMMNPAFAKMHGYTVAELTGRPILEVFAPESQAEVPAQINQVHQLGHHAFESEHIRKDGSIFPVWIDMTAVKNDQGEVLYRAVNVLDITDLKQTKEELWSTYRALQALSAVNQALIHAQEETALLAEVCRVIVEVAGYRMAWVGYADHDAEKTVRPVAQAGFDDGYINSIKVTWDSGPTGQGGMGRAIRSSEPWVIRDTSKDPNFSPWAQEALKRGFGATISLPLVADSSTFGSLAIYAEKDSFDVQEVAFLEQLGRNLSYGIDSLRVRARHQDDQAEMHKLAQAVSQASDWVVITDTAGAIEYANAAAVAMSGYTKEELIGKNPRILKSSLHEAQVYQDLWSAITSGQSYRNILINRKKDGELFHLDMTITPLRDPAGNIIKYLSTAKDITQQVKLQEHLNYLAYYDPLTGLANRTLFMDRIQQALASSKHSGNFTGLIILDLDRFKFINETYGPLTGDEVLQEVSQKLAGLVREGDSVARLGSDEYGILLADLNETDDIMLVLEKIRKGITQSVQAQGQDLMLTFSMGIAIYPQDGTDAPALLQNAESALAKAKEMGGNNFQFYAMGMNAKAANFVQLGNQLLRAFQQKEFILHYQPYYQASSGSMVGMEALIRWQHPERGLVPPGDFIPILEDIGLIREVGEWTLREACRQVKECQRQGYTVGPVSVNFSAVQFGWPGLVNLVERVLKDCELDPHFLTAEITESAIMHDVEYTESVLTSFKKLGMSISIDDFGTGYSSLSYLKRFPINNLKIDISFIREVTTDADTAAIVQAIISMAHSLDLKTIAEGVESKDQLQILRLLRCDTIQGYYYSRPLPAEEFRKLLDAGRSLS